MTSCGTRKAGADKADGDSTQDDAVAAALISQPVFEGHEGAHLPVGIDAGRRPHPGNLEQLCLNVAQLHPLPAHLDLPVPATEELECTIIPAGATIAGPVQARASVVGQVIGNERQRCPPGVAEVPTADASTADENLALDAEASLATDRVDNVNTCVEDLPTDRRPCRGRRLVVRDDVMRHVIRALRRPVRVHEKDLRAQLVPPSRQGP